MGTRQSRKVLRVVLDSLFFKEIWKNGTRQWRIQGGGGGAPPLCLEQIQARRAEKIFFLGDRPSPPPYLRVWMTGSVPLSQGLYQALREAMDLWLRVLKECNKNRLDSYTVRKCVDHIPYYLSGLSSAHFFRQPFSKYLVTLLTPADSLLWWFVNVTTTNMARSVSHCMRGNMDNTVA